MELKKYLGKQLVGMKSGKKYPGVCTSVRSTGSGDQIFLKLHGQPSRYFFTYEVREIAKQAPVPRAPMRAGAKKDPKVGSAEI